MNARDKAYGVHTGSNGAVYLNLKDEKYRLKENKTNQTKIKQTCLHPMNEQGYHLSWVRQLECELTTSKEEISGSGIFLRKRIGKAYFQNKIA